MHRKPMFVLLAGVVLFLSGCHSQAPSVVVPVSDACSVLTPAEVSAVIAAPIDAGKHIPASSTVMCSWSESGATGETAVKVVLNFTSLVSFQREKTATTPNIILTPASGVGDEAFYVTTEFGTSLYVRKGNTAIACGVHDKSLPTDQLMAKEKALGLEAAARL